MTQEKVDRNEEIIKDSQAGISTYKIALKYNITPPRVFFIIKRLKEKQANKNI